MLIIWEFISHPLTYSFIQRSFIASSIVGIVCAIFSCFLVLRRWSLLGDALSHAVLPGVALAAVFGFPLMLGALISGLSCNIIVSYLKSKVRIKEDSLIGIAFSGLFALGIVLLTKIETDVHIMHVLFGDILGIRPQDLWEISIISAISLVFILFKKQDLILFCFDKHYASLSGINVKLLNLFLLIFLTLTIVIGLKTTGTVLVVSMLITPGAVGFLLAKSFDKMLLVAALVAIISSFSGNIFSFYLDSAPAPLIVLIQTGIFLIAILLTKTKSITQHNES